MAAHRQIGVADLSATKLMRDIKEAAVDPFLPYATSPTAD